MTNKNWGRVSDLFTVNESLGRAVSYLELMRVGMGSVTLLVLMEIGEGLVSQIESIKVGGM